MFAIRSFWLALLAVCFLAGCMTRDFTYVEDPTPRGWHPFNRPKKGNAADQWEYVQQLQAGGHSKTAAKQAYALRIFYGDSPEAPAAQLMYARWLDGQGKLQAAFEQYQYLLDHYGGYVDFKEVTARQMDIARRVKDERMGKWGFFPGVHAPERAIPLFEQLLNNAPEGDFAAEAWFRKGEAHEAAYEYTEAITAYFTAFNRFPKSAFAEQALRAYALCNTRVAKDTPNDNRALDIARAACLVYLQNFPEGEGAGKVRTEAHMLTKKQERNAYDRAVYYDATLRQTNAAVIEYNSFIERFPESEFVKIAKTRIQQLGGAPPEKGTP